MTMNDMYYDFCPENIIYLDYQVHMAKVVLCLLRKYTNINSGKFEIILISWKDKFFKICIDM